MRVRVKTPDSGLGVKDSGLGVKDEGSGLASFPFDKDRIGNYRCDVSGITSFPTGGDASFTAGAGKSRPLPRFIGGERSLEPECLLGDLESWRSREREREHPLPRGGERP